MTNKTQTLALAGGGTMGHISPNLALLPYLKKYFTRIIYIGSKNSMEELQAKKHGIEFFYIDTIKFNRKNLLKNFQIPFILRKARKQVAKIMREQNVSAVFSKGGFASVPVMLEAGKLNIPFILHESDMSMGLANKLGCIHAKQIFVSTTRAKESLRKKYQEKTIVTGIPVKEEFCVTTKKESSNQHKKIMIVTGGSQGSKTINTLIRKSLKELTMNYHIIHIVGKGNIDKTITEKDYEQIEFSFNMPELFKKADIIISRAGATTIFEGLKSESSMLLIPLPKSKHSRGDQVENAKYFYELGLTDYIEEYELDKTRLIEKIKSIERNREKQQKIIKEFNKNTLSTPKIAEIIHKTLTVIN